MTIVGANLGKGDIRPLLVVYMGVASMESIVEVSQKAKNRTADPTVPLLGVYSGVSTSYNSYLFPKFTVDLLIVVMQCNQSRCSAVKECIVEMYFSIYTVE